MPTLIGFNSKLDEFGLFIYEFSFSFEYSCSNSDKYERLSPKNCGFEFQKCFCNKTDKM